MNGLVAKLCGSWLGHTVPGSTAHSGYVKLPLTRTARRMQTTYAVGENDSLALPKRRLRLRWKAFGSQNLKISHPKKRGETFTYHPPHKLKKGQWLRCVIGTYLPWLTVFSRTETLQARQGLTWRETEGGKMMFLVYLPVVMPPVIESQEKRIPKVSTMDETGEP